MNLKKLFRAVLRVVFTNTRLLCGKIVHGGRLYWSPVICLGLSDGVEMSTSARVNLGRGLRTRGRCLFNCQESGSLVFGRDVFLNSGCQFNCHRSIVVGDGCEFGPNVLVYDHDHDYPGGAQR